ncbi:MAG: uroporphyrinogen decarboxylase [Candidatus Kariarchaeaceae archaeon]|jgi:uroporphyrinogen decarboxylase
MNDQYTGKELILGAFSGKSYPTFPVWFMRQAGRYLPEYMKIREKSDFEERCQTPELASEITLQPIERYDMDAAIIFSDILVPIYGMDRGLKIIPQKGPIIDEPITSPEDVKSLKKTNSKEDFQYLPESIKLVRKEIPNKALFGFSGAPFTLASYLIEGKSTKDALLTKAFALKHPHAYDQLLNLLTDIVIDQLQSQINSGVDVIQVFDSWAGFLSPDQFSSWALPYTKRIFETLSETPCIFYARGSSHLFALAAQSGADGISIDTTMSLTDARSKIKSETVLQGNLDPTYLLTNPKLVRENTVKILNEANSLGSPHYIFNLARGIDRNSSLENVKTMIDTVKSFRRN